MKRKFERGDRLLPSDTGKPWPSYLLKIKIIGICENAGHYIFIDKSGCYWSAPFAMIETNYLKIKKGERQKAMS